MAKKAPVKPRGKSVADLAGGGQSAPAGGGGWFQTGYDAVGEEVKRIDTMREEWKNQIRRYWMPEKDDNGKTIVAVVVFIDGIPFSYREHQFYLNGNWRNWQTCLVGTGAKCPYCEAQNKNYFVGAYTVVDTREWKSKDNTVHKNEISFYPVKGDALKALRILADARGGDLAGCAFRVSRSGDKSPNTGNVFDFIERLPTKKIRVKMTGIPEREITVLDTQNAAVAKKFGFKQLVKPFDYPAVVKPKTRDEALTWLGSQNISAGSGEGNEGAAEVAY
jgi:hypothetical protein